MLIGKISEELIFQYVEKTSALVFGNFTSLKSRIALQVARKIAPCNMALTRIDALCFVEASKFRQIARIC
jgi:hypothetical protein